MLAFTFFHGCVSQIGLSSTLDRCLIEVMVEEALKGKRHVTRALGYLIRLSCLDPAKPGIIRAVESRSESKTKACGLGRV